MLKQTFVTFMLLVAGMVHAEDITNPFYLPDQKQVGLVTSAAVKRYVEKNATENAKSRRLLVKEDVQIGLTDSLALIGALGNIWDKWQASWDKPAWTTRTDWENFQWDAGLAWNVLKGPARLQVSAKYGQNRLQNFAGEYKYATGEVMFGYQFKRLLPYITGSIEVPIGQKSGLKGYAGDKLIYDTKVGVYQGSCEKWSLDTGVRLKYDENLESRTVLAEAEASYYLTPRISMGIYGSYMLDGRAKYGHNLYEKELGARLRLFF